MSRKAARERSETPDVFRQYMREEADDQAEEWDDRLEAMEQAGAVAPSGRPLDRTEAARAVQYEITAKSNENVTRAAARRSQRVRLAGKEFTLEERDALRAAFDYKCVFCGNPEKLTIEHLTPVVQFGKDEIDNAAVACKRCNSTKHGKALAEWLSRYSEATAVRIRGAIAKGQARARVILKGGS